MTVINFPGTTPCEEPPAELSIIEPAPVVEIFSVDLARVYVHGPFARMVWTVPEQPLEYAGGKVQNIVTCKIVVPTVALQAIYEAIGKHLPAGPEGAAS